MVAGRLRLVAGLKGPLKVPRDHHALPSVARRSSGSQAPC